MSDEADAARYRWLKSRAWVEDRDGGWVSYFKFPMIEAHNDSPNPAWALARRDLDAAIDAELAPK
jgi:hypothetical protein